MAKLVPLVISVPGGQETITGAMALTSNSSI